jgi:lysozyme family protein
MSTPSKYISLDYYQNCWDTMLIAKNKVPYIIADAKKVLAHKERFENVVKIAGGSIPWYFIGIIYLREEGCNFRGHAHNGNNLKLKTVDVPSGRPIAPPANPIGYTFEESMLDLIKLKEWDKVKAWILPLMLYKFEANNGFGYHNRGINSPYVWNFTNHYTSGYFVADGRFNPEVVNKSTGCAVLLRYLTDKTLGLVQ